MTIGENDIIKCSVVWSNIGGVNVNVHHVQVTQTAAKTQAQIRADIGEFFEDAYASIVSSISNTLLHDRIDLFNISDGNPETTIPAIAALDGGSAGEALPTQSSAEVYFRTGVSRHIGRTFTPFMAEGANAGAEISSAVRTALQTFGDYFINGQTMTNGVTVRKMIYDPSAAVARGIIDAVVPLYWRTQRRRTFGRGG